MDAGGSVEFFDPYKRVPYYIYPAKPISELIPSITPTEAAKAKSRKICLVTLESWEAVIGLILIVAESVLAIVCMVLVNIFSCPIFEYVPPWAMAGAFAVMSIFIIWKVACNLHIKTKRSESPLLPYNATPKYALKIPEEVSARIAELKLPDFDKLPQDAQKVCAHLGVYNTTGMQKCISSTIGKPYFQSGPNCFAAAHFLRWLFDEQELVINILYQLFTRGEINYQAPDGTTATIRPFLQEGNSSAAELIVDSMSAHFEEKTPLLGGLSKKTVFFLDEMDAVVREISAESHIKTAFDEWLKRQSFKTLREAFERRYRQFGCYVKHMASGFFHFTVTIKALLKSCDMPSMLRKIIVARFVNRPLFTGYRQDVLHGGHYGETGSSIFSAGARNVLLATDQPEKFLKGILALKKEKKFRPGTLLPAHFTVASAPGIPSELHEANAIVPEIDDFNAVEDGRFIPLLMTGWCRPCQFGVMRLNGRWEWVDVRGRHVIVVGLHVYDPAHNTLIPTHNLPTLIARTFGALEGSPHGGG
jgi:hypothetical protein